MSYVDETGLAEVTTKLKAYVDNKSSGGAVLITKTITANGTYNASDDDATGYSQVEVNVISNANEFDLLLSGNYGYMTSSVCDDIINGNYIYNGGIN